MPSLPLLTGKTVSSEVSGKTSAPQRSPFGLVSFFAASTKSSHVQPLSAQSFGGSSTPASSNASVLQIR